MDEAKRQIELAEADMRKQKFDMKINGQKMKGDIDKALKDARRSLERSKEEMKNLKEFTDALEKEGLIDKSKAYKIEVKDGDLYINGKKQYKRNK